MSRLNRVVVAAVLAIAVMLPSAGGVVGANPQPAPRGVCTKVGDVVSAPVPLVCKQTVKNGLRWRRAPIPTTTTTTTTSVAPSTTVAVVPTVSLAATFLDSGTFPKAAVVTSNVAGTVYFIEGASPVNTVSDITSAQYYRWTSGVVTANTPTSIALDVDVLTNGYYRVFVANSQGVLSVPAVNKVTISNSRASDVAVLSCAAGGTCIVGNTGPGGGVVFYVAALNFTSNGSTCATECKYLEAATTDQSTGIVWATTAASCYNSGSTTDNNNCQTNSIYLGSSTEQDASRTSATAIGKGMENTNQAYDRLTKGGAATNAYAAGIAWAYTNNGKTDWHLPSKDELNELFLRRARVGGFSTGRYWSSSEAVVDDAWAQSFFDGLQTSRCKECSGYVRPVRAF